MSTPDEQEVLEASVQMRTDGDDLLVPVKLGNGRTILASLTPAAIEAIKQVDQSTLRPVGMKNQWRVVYDVNGQRQEGPWLDVEPIVEQREVSSTTPSERPRPSRQS